MPRSPAPCPDCRITACSRHLVACPACDSCGPHSVCSTCKGLGECTEGQALEVELDTKRCEVLMLNADAAALKVEIFALRKLLADMGVTDHERAAAVASAIRKQAA